MRSISFRRAVAAIAATALIAVGGIATASPSQDDVDDAYARAKELLRQARAARQQVEATAVRVRAIAERIAQQEGEVEALTAELLQTEEVIDEMRARFHEISALLNERAVEAYMSGPGSTIGILLGSESMVELSDRLEFVQAVAQNDVDLANEVVSARNELQATAARLKDLRERERAALDRIRADEAALLAELAERQDLLEEIERKEAAAARHAKDLNEERQDYLDSLAAPPSTGGSGQLPPGARGVFRVCPVDEPKVVTDSFGAPRYVGGYHPHRGDDIMAPGGTPIRAPFAGIARDATNRIGGISVIVQGANGYVYNAHMSRLGSLGAVAAGDVIGYVGMTGASGAGVNHNHFEYHPNVTPTGWPESPYGYSIIDDAVNPFPLLSAVC